MTKNQKTCIKVVSTFGVVVILFISLLAWLAHDDAELLYKPNIELYAPTPEGGEESYALLKRVADIGDEAGKWSHAFKKDKKVAHQAVKDKTDNADELYRDFILNHAEEIQSHYQLINPNVELLAKLAKMPVIGDLTKGLAEESAGLGLMKIQDIVKYQMELDAYLGKSVNLQPSIDLYQVVIKGSHHVRSLIHWMVYIAVEKHLLTSWNKTASYLDEEQSERLRQALKNQIDYYGNWERVMLVEYCFIYNMNPQLFDGSVKLKWFMKYMLNPNSTFNQIVFYHKKGLTLLRSRKFTELKNMSEKLAVKLDQFSIKNYAGKSFIIMGTPVHLKQMAKIEQREQEREELKSSILAQLAKNK